MNSYEEVMKIYNKLSYYERQFVIPKEDSIYRYVIKDKAFIDIIPYCKSKDSGLVNIAVLLKYRRQGLTKTLVNKAVENCKELGIKSLIWKCKIINNQSYMAAKSNGFNFILKEDDELILERIV